MHDGSNTPLIILSLAAFVAGGAFAAQADTGEAAKVPLPRPAIEARLDGIDPVRSIIESQLKAFRKSDPAGAYQFASESAKLKYGSAKNFFKMMRVACHALPHHVSYSFMERRDVGDKVLQKIEFLNTDGSASTGFYRLAKNADGAWAVDGCLMLQADAQPI